MAIVVFLMACLTHFLPLGDPHIPPERSDHKRSQPELSEAEAFAVKMEVAQVWAEIELKMDDIEREELKPPASEADIENLENMIGMRLPPYFRASLLIHNGANGLLSVEEMLDDHQSEMRYLDFNRLSKLSSEHPANLVFTRELFGHSVQAAEEPHALIQCDSHQIFGYRPIQKNGRFAWPRKNSTSSFTKRQSNFLEYLQHVSKKSKHGDIWWAAQ